MPDLLGADDSAAIIEETAPLFRPGVADGARSHYRVQDAWQESPAVRGLACHPRVTAILAALYGRRPLPFQTLNFSTGTQQRNHSDSIHFSSLPAGFMCGVWVALEDTDAGNGPLFYAPGSHTLPVLTLTDLGMTLEDGSYAQYEEGITDAISAAGLGFEEVHVPRGTAFIWSANLVHGGMPIAEVGRTRHSQVTHYFFDDCVYYTPLYSDIPTGALFIRDPIDIGTGERVTPSLNGRRVFFEPAGGDRMRLRHRNELDDAADEVRARYAALAAGYGPEAARALDILVTVYQARDDLRAAFGPLQGLDLGGVLGWSLEHGIGADAVAPLLRAHEQGLRQLAHALSSSAAPAASAVSSRRRRFGRGS